MSGRVLVVDDEETFAEGCRHILTEEGYQVDIAVTGEDALDKIGKGSYDIVLLDLRIGDFDGIRVLERVRAMNLDTDVIIITGYASVETATRALRYGATDYLEKPLDPEHMTAALENIMRRRVGELPEPAVVSEVRMRVEGFDSRASSAVAEAVSRDVGVGKARWGVYQLAVLGFFAGAYIAFGAALATLVGHDLPARVGLGLTKLISGAAFSVGLMLVVIAGAELFTGNNLMLVSALDGHIRWRTLLHKWTIVYFANFLGAVALAGLIYGSGLWRTGADYGVARSAIGIANAKVNLPFYEAVLRGVACNWLVCLAVWMAMSARQVSCKILAILFPIMAFVALGFEHSVANMYFVPLGIILKGTEAAALYGGALESLTWPTFLARNLVPVTIGNVIGGAGLVGVLYWSVYLRKPRQATATAGA
jgi:formate/nitrite transporter